MPVFPKVALLLVGMIGAQPATNALPGPETTPTKVTVRQVVSMRALAGTTVQVSGRCLDKAAPHIAAGSRPISGAVWQLEDNGVATWVIGEMPRDCASGQAVVTARVMQDLLPRFSPPRTLRQYLVVQ
jgi:hypothetical protein